MSRILLVDDDQDLHRLIAPTLKSDGHDVLAAATGAAGLKILEKKKVDLALIDYRLPGMDGLQFLDEVRGKYPDIRCVMITAFGTPEAVLGAIRRRVCDFLVKPFTVAELRATVDSVMSSCPMFNIEIVSATRDWVELRLPCDLGAVPVLQRLLSQLKNDLPEQTREAIAYAFREMLNNAIEHGGKLDPSKQVEVACLRTRRAIIYWIKVSGRGFRPVPA